MAVFGLVVLAGQAVQGQSLTWDSSGTNPANAFDGAGFWNTTSLRWTDGLANSGWVNGATAIIGNNNGAASTITIDQSGITAAGITFNPPGSGDYTIGATGGNSLTLVAPATTTVATGLNPTISAPISGSAGLNLTGPGTLNLAGNNIFSGDVTANSGALSVGSNNALGLSTNGFVLGTSNTGTGINNTASAIIGAGVNSTTNSFRSSTNNSTSNNTLTIGDSATLSVVSNAPLNGLNSSVNGVFVVGAPNAAAAITTSMVVTGNGTLSVNGGSSNSSFLAGVGNSNTSSFVGVVTLDMSSLANFSFVTGTGAVPANGGNEFAVGHGAGLGATVSLAANSNITAGTLSVGNGTLTPGLAGGGPNASGTNPGILNLGSAINTINTNAILLGNGRTRGVLQWASSVSTGTLKIAGATGGASTADITVGTMSSGTPPGTASSLDITGHDVTVQAGTVIAGNLAGGSGGTSNTKGGSVVFDTGIFNVANLQLSVGTSGSAGGSIAGTFTVGSGPSSTGVLNVTSQFLIGDNTGATNAVARGTFNVRGGTANIATNIIDASTVATSNTTLALSGGTLNMQGFAIGPVGGTGGGTRHITTITFPSLGNSAVLQSLGGTGINDAGLTMTGTGALILAGNSTYSGGTTIASGTLQVGQTSDDVPPTNDLQDRRQQFNTCLWQQPSADSEHRNQRFRRSKPSREWLDRTDRDQQLFRPDDIGGRCAQRLLIADRGWWWHERTFGFLKQRGKQLSVNRRNFAIHRFYSE